MTLTEEEILRKKICRLVSWVESAKAAKGERKERVDRRLSGKVKAPPQKAIDGRRKSTVVKDGV